MTGERIKEIRKALGLSVPQACAGLGLSKASARKWRRWESGAETMPSGIADDWADLAAKHGVC